jgi:hypothetical protein
LGYIQTGQSQLIGCRFTSISNKRSNSHERR